MSEYYQKNRPKLLQKRREYYQKHKAEAHEYYEKNKEYYRAYN